MYYKDELSIEEDWPKWDLFLSAYNLSERLKKVFDKVDASEKFWLIFPEYDFSDEELPTQNDMIKVEEGSEATQLIPIIERLSIEEFKDKSICIDATGFMRAQLLFLLAFFKKKGFNKVDFLYCEPSNYSKKEDTKFSEGSLYETRQVIGYQGRGSQSYKKDLLIVSCGYDSQLISRVAQQYENSEIVPLLGFPSLRADMFQESILRTVAAEESFAPESLRKPIFAPASDPFETAFSISQYIHNNDCLKNYEHIYLCPLSTKPQVLGMGLVFLNEFERSNVSVLYPFSEKYSKETSQGISKMWKFTFEF
ncbi:TPA: hypothetical protein NJ504_002588 [Vibrio parahaemolyticus]|nr:hypothetical protein [Vibrio parahaemolyticus]